jgi:hypothetical protein
MLLLQQNTALVVSIAGGQKAALVIPLATYGNPRPIALLLSFAGIIPANSTIACGRVFARFLA